MKFCSITLHSSAFGKVRELVGQIKYAFAIIRPKIKTYGVPIYQYSISFSQPWQSFVWDIHHQPLNSLLWWNMTGAYITLFIPSAAPTRQTYSFGSVLKLVLLEWSESKSDGKFGYSMLKNPPVQVFRVIRATIDVWQHIIIFAWWHVHVILSGSTYYNIYYGRNFRQQFPVPKLKNQL